MATNKPLLTARSINPQGKGIFKQAIARAKTYGFTHRYYGSDLAFWLPEPLELKEIISRFEGIAIDSIARQPVRLEHIYVEVTKN